MIGTETGEPGNKRASGHHQNYIVEIGRNTKKCSGE